VRPHGAATALGSLLVLVGLCSGQDVGSPTPAPVSEVRGVVTDTSGAVIQRSEVVFKGDSGTIVSHTGDDGSVTVHLPAGTYTVTIASPNFVSTKLADFRVSAPTPASFRVALEVDRTHLGPFFLQVANIGSGRAKIHARILMFLAVIFLTGVAIGCGVTAWAMRRKSKP
jgi:hypothetical protein